MIWASDSETIRQKMMEISKLIGQLPTCSIHQLVNLLTLLSHGCCKFSSQISLVRRDRLASVLRDTSSLRTKQSLLDLRLQMRHQEQLHRALTSNSTRMPSPSQWQEQPISSQFLSQDSHLTPRYHALSTRRISMERTRLRIPSWCKSQ